DSQDIETISAPCCDVDLSISVCPFISPLSRRARSSNRSLMQDTLTLRGDHESRVAQLLRIAQHEARLAQREATPRTQDALTELEDALSDQLAGLDAAADDGV